MDRMDELSRDALAQIFMNISLCQNKCGEYPCKRDEAGREEHAGARRKRAGNEVLITLTPPKDDQLVEESFSTNLSPVACSYFQPYIVSSILIPSTQTLLAPSFLWGRMAGAKTKQRGSMSCVLFL